MLVTSGAEWPWSRTRDWHRFCQDRDPLALLPLKTHCLVKSLTVVLVIRGSKLQDLLPVAFCCFEVHC
ncbi:hypothetical protein TNCV_1424241 [Trichonephila clavipes]|nr:hypothetical protein TNCV_1424241 [Trichonephila clavipes]